MISKQPEQHQLDDYNTHARSLFMTDVAELIRVSVLSLLLKGTLTFEWTGHSVGMRSKDLYWVYNVRQ